MEMPVSSGNAITNNIMIQIAQTANNPCPAVKSTTTNSTEKNSRDTFSVGKSDGARRALRMEVANLVDYSRHLLV